MNLLQVSYGAHALGLAVALSSWSLGLWAHLARSDGVAAWGRLVRLSEMLCFATAALFAIGIAAAFLPAGGEGAPGQSGYLRRLTALSLLLVLLLYFALPRMDAWDASPAAVATMVWYLWALAVGWRALAAGSPVTGPFGWQLAAGLAGLGLVGLALLLFGLSRMNRLF